MIEMTFYNTRTVVSNKKCFHGTLNGMAIRENFRVQRYDSPAVLMLYVRFLFCRFLDAVTKFRKSTAQFAMPPSVSPFARNDIHCSEFSEFLYLRVFRKAVEKI